MFYPEFTISLWLVSSVLVAVFAGVCWAMGAEYIGKNLINFYPEVGTGVTSEQETLKAAEKTELKKAA